MGAASPFPGVPGTLGGSPPTVPAVGSFPVPGQPGSGFPATAFGPAPASSRPPRKFTAGSRTPLWLALAAIVLTAATWIVPFVIMASSLSTDDFDGTDVPDGMAGALVALVVLWLASTIVSIASLVRIGSNAGTYGAIVPLHAAFPLWIVLTAGIGGQVAILGTVLYFVWPFQQLITGLWESGRLPRVFALFGWVPPALAAASGLLDVGPVYDRNDLVVAIQTVTAMAGRLSVLFCIGAYITVVVIQHVGIARDREVLANWRPERA
ncbi:hypothetical protein ACE2AJ_16225 [Aquihabitans daechungensis]|uniref:hypothetical protein n=1 Tax=Aquihabitans daechungensis TaxID=1052257 RepID=UPI003B9E2AD5